MTDFIDVVNLGADRQPMTKRAFRNADVFKFHLSAGLARQVAIASNAPGALWAKLGISVSVPPKSLVMDLAKSPAIILDLAPWNRTDFHFDALILKTLLGVVLPHSAAIDG